MFDVREEEDDDRAVQLAVGIPIALAAGQRGEAEAFGAELEALCGKVLPMMRAHDVVGVTRGLWDLGRPLEPVARAAAARSTRVWHQVAHAIARGELVEAANRLAKLGARPFEAYVRLRAAEELSAAGSSAAAAVQLEQALDFYRSMGAVFYVRRGEALLAATA